MKTFLIGLAYFLIYTTPIGVGFTLWIYWEIVASDHTFWSLSMNIFLIDHLEFLRDWLYSWFWNDWLDFWWALPAAILSTVKLTINTVLGFWLLPVAKAMP